MKLIALLVVLATAQAADLEKQIVEARFAQCWGFAHDIEVNLAGTVGSEQSPYTKHSVCRLRRASGTNFGDLCDKPQTYATPKRDARLKKARAKQTTDKISKLCDTLEAARKTFCAKTAEKRCDTLEGDPLGGCINFDARNAECEALGWQEYFDLLESHAPKLRKAALDAKAGMKRLGESTGVAKIDDSDGVKFASEDSAPAAEAPKGPSGKATAK